MILAASTAELTIRMLVSLALMGLVALGSMKVLRGRVRLGPTARAGLVVEARTQLTRTAGVAVVRVGDRRFLLGVSDQAVTLLAEGDDLITKDPAPPADGEATGGAGRRRRRADGPDSSGMRVIEALREKTVRRS